MDLFGIGKAVESTIRIDSQTARKSGRTKMMINSLKSGDRVVFNNQNEANRVDRLCRERGLEIECTVLSPKNLERIPDIEAKASTEHCSTTLGLKSSILKGLNIVIMKLFIYMRIYLDGLKNMIKQGVRQGILKNNGHNQWQYFRQNHGRENDK